MERRYFELREMHIEPESESGPRRIRGYAAVFNSRSLDLGGFVEEILPGAFARTLREMDQVALWSHDESKPLGRRSNGTLLLREDERGLAVDIIPPDTTWGRDALISVERGDVRGMSFAFNVAKNGDSWRKEGDLVVRTLKDLDLPEISPVVFPAYPSTSVSTRDIYGDIPDIPASLCGATSAADTDDDGAGALDINKRLLDLLSI